MSTCSGLGISIAGHLNVWRHGARYPIASILTTHLPAMMNAKPGESTLLSRLASELSGMGYGVSDQFSTFQYNSFGNGSNPSTPLAAY